jgi:hypothetical protein
MISGAPWMACIELTDGRVLSGVLERVIRAELGRLPRTEDGRLPESGTPRCRMRIAR